MDHKQPQSCVTSPRDNYAICTQQMFSYIRPIALDILLLQQQNSVGMPLD